MSKIVSMRSREIGIVLSILCFTWSCSVQNEKSLEKTIVLEGKEIQSEVLFRFSRMIVYDSLLIVKKFPPKGKSLAIMNTNDFSLISHVVKIGRGPGELANPFALVILDNISK